MQIIQPSYLPGAFKDVPDKDRPWPLPECRLNEYPGMINMQHGHRHSGFTSRSIPACKSFRRWTKLATFAHFDHDNDATDSWVSLKNAGHNAMFNKELCRFKESVALQCLKEKFGYQPCKPDPTYAKFFARKRGGF